METTHRRALIVAVTLTLILGACGGGGDDSANDAGADDQGQDSGDGSTSEDVVPEPTIDAGAMPPAGEAHLEVDGQTFVFKQSEMLEGPFTCEIRDNGITINFQSDRHDLLLQGAVTPDGKIIATATVAPETSDLKYTTSGAAGRGAVATEAPYVVYTGIFDSYPADDPTSFTDVGMGTISVTCP